MRFDVGALKTPLSRSVLSVREVFRNRRFLNVFFWFIFCDVTENEHPPVKILNKFRLCGGSKPPPYGEPIALRIIIFKYYKLN